MTDNTEKDWPITFRGMIYPHECDHLGHLNVAHYVAKLDQASWNLMALIGVDTDFINREKRAFAAVDQHIQYKREVLAGDTLTIRSAIRAIGGKTCRFYHEMTNNRTGDIAATCTLAAVHMDLEARRGVVVDDRIVAAAQAYLEPEE